MNTTKQKIFNSLQVSVFQSKAQSFKIKIVMSF